MGENGPIPEWRSQLDERETKEVLFARIYSDLRHGTDGHSRLMLINKLVEMLDAMQREVNDLKDKVKP